MTPRRRSLGMLLVALGAAAIAQAEDQSAAGRRTIAVTGQGEVRAVPDRVTLSFAVETTAARATEAAAENARRSTAVATAVKGLIDADDKVTTARYLIEPRYDTPRPGERQEPRILGYVARNEVALESRRIDKVGALIDAAIGAGADRVGALQFSASNRAELLRAAIEKAGADARAQAESAARGLGVRLKEVVTATTSPGPVLTRRLEPMAAAEARLVATPVEPGEVTVSATLQVTYSID